MRKVLLTDGRLRMTLAATRSLGRRGLQVFVADKTMFHMAGWSKHCAGRVVNPDPRRKPEEFLAWLMDYLERERPDAFFPMDDDVRDLVIGHQDEIKKLTGMSFPPAESYVKFRDKRVSAAWVAAAGIRCPETYQYNNALPPLPVAIKPRSSSGSRGFRVAKNPQEFWRYYQEIRAVDPEPLLQEYIEPGPRYSVCLLYDLQGQLKGSYVQKQLRGFPIPHGPSIAQESVCRPDLVKMALKVMSRTPWQGMVEFEFLEDAQNGQPVFLEANPRFWNSVYLSIMCGADFPWFLFQTIMGEEVPEFHEYPVGVRGHTLLPSDFLYFLASPDRFRLDPPVWWINSGGMHDAMLAWDDPGATVGFFLAILRDGLETDTWKKLARR